MLFYVFRRTGNEEEQNSDTFACLWLNEFLFVRIRKWTFPSVWDLDVFSSVPAVFCDYYNPPDKHEWFYKPCGAPCLKTCRNPQGKCGNLLYSLEGNSCLTLIQLMWVEESDFKCLKHQGCCLTFKDCLFCPRNSLTMPLLGLISHVIIPFIAEYACCL